MRFQSIAEAVGRTPLIELKNIGREYGLCGKTVCEGGIHESRRLGKRQSGGGNFVGRGAPRASERRDAPDRADQREHGNRGWRRSPRRRGIGSSS